MTAPGDQETPAVPRPVGTGPRTRGRTGGFTALTDSARQITYSCGGCDTHWPGVSRCHCSGCHFTFNGLDLFDKHRREHRGEGYCVLPSSIVNKAGERVMFLTNGIWSSVENPVKRVAPSRKP